MDLTQNFQDLVPESQSSENVTTKQKCNTALVQSTETGSGESFFECSICFDSAHDPVVTLCGHLYCWACIFKWLHTQSSSSEPIDQQACPVCKANISQASLIPLFCNGPSQTTSELRKPHRDVIPPRPTACGLQTLITSANSHTTQLPSNVFQSQSPAFHHQQYFSDPYGSYAAITSSNLVSTTMAGIINPTIGLLGELVNPRMSEGMFTFPLPSSYAVVGHSNPRTRRQELMLDKSLSRVSFFLFCGLLLCLLLF